MQTEPSSTWHQNVTAEDPYIYHYTFGVEYALDGIPVVGCCRHVETKPDSIGQSRPGRSLAEAGRET